MKTQIMFLLSLLFTLVFSGSAMAKGAAQVVVVEGFGIAEPIRITDTELLAALTVGQLVDFTQPRANQHQTVLGPLLTRFFADANGEETAFDRVMIFYSAEGGEAYGYYLGLVNGGSEYDGKWFVARPEGIAALQLALSESGIAREAAGPVSQMGFEPLVLALMAGGIGWALGQRRINK